MKRFVLTAAETIIVVGSITGAGFMYADESGAATVEAKTEVTPMNHGKAQESLATINRFPEFGVLNKQINVANFQAQVVENNAHKRVIMMSNENGQAQFKSIFVKDTNRLKVVDFHQGLVFNQILTDAEWGKFIQKNQKPQMPDGNLPELDVLDEQVDADNYQLQVVENNERKRIIIMKDENGNPQYKSILEKEQNILEIIDFGQGMIFKGAIG